MPCSPACLSDLTLRYVHCSYVWILYFSCMIVNVLPLFYYSPELHTPLYRQCLGTLLCSGEADTVNSSRKDTSRRPQCELARTYFYSALSLLDQGHTPSPPAHSLSSPLFVMIPRPGGIWSSVLGSAYMPPPPGSLLTSSSWRGRPPCLLGLVSVPFRQ